MFRPVPLYIGLRYTRARKKNHFVSFISLSSMLGIALGVMVLITVLSVMNGFDAEIHNRFFGMAPEITVSGREGESIKDWKALEARLMQFPGVRAVAPFVGGQGLITHDGQVLPIVLTGIEPQAEEKITHLADKLLAGSLEGLSGFGMIPGRQLADSLGLMLGDKVTVMIPQATVTPAGMIPRFKRFTVTGVFSAGTGFNFDTKLAFIGLQDAQKLFQTGDGVTGLKLKITNIYAAPALSEQIAASLGEDYEVGNWTNQFGSFFEAVKMEKTMMFSILVLIIAVAAFNLVSSLVMVVNDKQAEIAILRTIGATPACIMRIFVVQGMMVGVVGTLMGLLSGLLLASNATAIVNALQKFFEVQVLSSSMYFVDFLPSKILASDLWKVSGIALSMSFLATLYPAWRASRTVIAEALHYE
ncbi:Lipoprotein-releasing system transmembrane protein lolC [Legionella geestiana]|uniref:Lipoprotein-releasing system transmembrane protein lolC n=1 Tax=Legionella geestiana TaxID=45065 RepID=A0A0W0U5G5_9GAMM|nr:lipoprotein-releasing ABC transporter permease subunit [Legionella geestiana]KTD02875.1 Lipoprotein-releasing system transmembrane protein lolC [Legionella geestiana]QBS11688.1 lipoprotein-releasing ABC transporter permease subunit [Legionella geestiana]QDQ40701.1 lipoprotein-releasing ABC transporter permease subunit [Legionella geestiana]STX53625.1 outer membrane-specific lipoprotein transporter subunit; membrane component of ABC superfamily [Legionella geestiana]